MKNYFISMHVYMSLMQEEINNYFYFENVIVIYSENSF